MTRFGILASIGAALAAPLAAKEIGPGDLATLPAADIYVIGEVHDNPVHHENQAAAIAALAPSAVVFEMLSPEQAAAGQDVDRADAQALEEALSWSAARWLDFALYYPIFARSGTARIYGAALPADLVRGAIGAGAAAQFGADAAAYGLDQELEEEEQSRRNTAQAVSHCNALPEEMIPGMVEAQRLRDAGFARTTLKALEETGGPVVVITGNGHARKDWGMPRFLRRILPEARILSIGQVVGGPPEAEFDLWLSTAPSPDNGDPCDVFRKSN
ncbi:MAG: ChaN family lipoprotein [Litoreibacter sp.]|nr:ChaN family lipoprotein [Litoreibacter sp.]